MKTYKARTLLEHSEENLSLSSLYISCNEIEFEEFVQFVQFIENHFLEKLHVRGRFRFPHRDFGMMRQPRQLSFRTDIDLILSEIVKHDALNIFADIIKKYKQFQAFNYSDIGGTILPGKL